MAPYCRGFGIKGTALQYESFFDVSGSQQQALIIGDKDTDALHSRRSWFRKVASCAVGASLAFSQQNQADATVPEQVTSAEELESLYETPAEIPQAPEERSGLVVLRVAEVAQFQEKILRAVVSGELVDVKVAPMQFQFGTQILLKNSHLDDNLKTMIATEIPRSQRADARKLAARTMNTLVDILNYSASIQRDFENEEMIALADMYRNVRVYLNELYEFLPPAERSKYYGFFVAVTEYEKKIADGVYNPDIDGVLKFD